MHSPLRAAIAAAAIAGAGLAGFGLTSALAQTDPGDDTTTTTEVPADEAGRRDAPGCAGPGLDALAEAIMDGERPEGMGPGGPRGPHRPPPADGDGDAEDDADA